MGDWELILNPTTAENLPIGAEELIGRVRRHSKDRGRNHIAPGSLDGQVKLVETLTGMLQILPATPTVQHVQCRACEVDVLIRLFDR